MKDGLLLDDSADGRSRGSPWTPAGRFSPSPSVATFLDVVVVVCLGAAASVLLFGGIRFRIGSLTISIGSIWRLALVATVLALARSWVADNPSLVQNARGAATGAWAWFRSSAARAVMPVWAVTRLGVVAVAFLAVATVGLPAGTGKVPAIDHALLNMAYRWDTGWYLGIAVQGYAWDPGVPERQQSIAFFPAYPMLARVGGAVLGARPKAALPGPAAGQRVWTRTLAAAWLLALAASAAAFCAFYKWSVRMAGPGVARRSVILLATFPFAIYYTAAYTESLYLLGAVGAFNAVLDRRAVGLGAWGGLVGLTRPNGFLLTVPLLLLAARAPYDRARLSVMALMPCAGMLAFSAYVWALTGHPFAWAQAHAAWGRTPATWDTAVMQRLDAVSAEGLAGYAASRPLEVLNGAAVLLALGFMPVVWRRIGAPAALFVAINVLPPLYLGGLMSMGRLTSTMFPVFVAMAVVIPRHHLPGWTMLFAMLQALAAVLFFTWRPLV